MPQNGRNNYNSKPFKGPRGNQSYGFNSNNGQNDFNRGSDNSRFDKPKADSSNSNQSQTNSNGPTTAPSITPDKPY